jgi:outer membrane immunogenic protein
LLYEFRESVQMHQRGRFRTLNIGELKMKKLVLALTAAAAFSAPALAADMAAKAPMRAAPVAYAASWTGCYVGGGLGFGMWNQENTTYDGRTVPSTQITATQTNGGRGYFGTVGAGCDYQFPAMGTSFIVGAFGDYDFASIKGQHENGFMNTVGQEKMSSAWAVGGRLGWVVVPNFMTYFSIGYTEATFDRQNYTNLFGPPYGIASAVYTDKQTYKGWFIGAGDEYALSFMPGLFWKTEYRFSEFDVASNYYKLVATGANTTIYDDSKKYVHSIRSELVYRFNWGGPVVAKY